MIAKNRSGFSLIELMVVVVIISILAALVLPSFKNMLSERKTNVAALEVKSFLEAARARAVSRGRNVSVILERLSSRGDGLGINPTIAVSATNPPRSITAQNPNGNALSQNAVFAASDDFLNYSQYNTCIRMTMAETLKPTEYEITGTVTASYSLGGIVTIQDNTMPTAQPLDRRFERDLVAGNDIELIEPSGVSNRFQIISPATHPTGAQTTYTFRVLNPGSGTQPFGAPADIGFAASSQQALRRFREVGSISVLRVYSQPKPLAAVTNELPRGTCIDLSLSGLASDDPLANYSGSEFTNCQREFASDWIMPPGRNGPPTPQQLRPVMITFSPSGNVDHIVCNGPQLTAFNPPAIPREFSSRRIEPNQDVFLFVGRSDQVIFPTDGTDLNALGIGNRRAEGAKPNMLDATGYWIRISATNGSVAAAPTQAWHVENDVAEAEAGNPADDLSEMLSESRVLTFQSELSSQ